MTGRERATVVRALEALDLGDAAEAKALLRAALREPGRRSHRCPVCQLAFRFPGEVDDHVRTVHAEAPVAA